MLKRKSVNLTRQLVAYNLMFGLLAVIVLVVGLVAMFRVQIVSDFQHQLDSLAARARSATRISYTVNGQQALQPLVERLATVESLASCSVVGIDGTYLAHTDPAMIGTVHQDQPGSRLQSDNYEDATVGDSESVTHYVSVDLSRPDSPLAYLQMEIVESQSWSRTWLLAARLPMLMMPSIAILLLGGYFLHRIVQPVIVVHDQLVKLARVQSVQAGNLTSIPTSSAMSVGWNRLIEEIDANLPTLDDVVDERISGLEKSRESRLLDSLPDGFAHSDAEGKIMFLNNAMTALLGMERSEFSTTESIIDCFDDDSDAAVDESQREQLRLLVDPTAFNRSTVAELRRVTDGGERILRVSRQPVRNQQQQQSRQVDVNPGQTWSIRDITQQRMADKARDEFLDSATHEIRTPLANIKAYAETLELSEMIDVEQQKQFCNIINDEATRLAKFIDELLDISSIEAGSLSVKKQKVELTRLIASASASVQPVMDQKSITFESLIDEKIPDLALDKEKFTTCLVNLLGNAAKYTPDGGNVTFRVRHGANCITMEVEDNGLGIAENELPKVFKKFFRSSDHRVHEETGTGLGLSFASEVIRLHGGTLTASSQLNQGSVFTITLPVPV